MKTKYIVAIVAVGLGLAATLFAAESQAVVKMKTILIKSHGETVAELRVPVTKTSTVEMKCNESPLVNASTGHMTFKGGVTIQINTAGGLPVTLKADEVEMAPAQY